MRTMVNLKPEEMPTQWYNILPDLPEPLPPPMDPEKGPSRIQNLPNLLVGECLNQEFSKENWIDIPDGIMDLFAKAGRPRPLFRATNLEKKLGTPGRMYYKSEFFSPTGSHKVNTALAQCWYAKKQGFERVTTETGAGQWGTALAYATAVTGLKCLVFWVRSVYNWKEDRLRFMKLLGAEVHASPSPMTEFGKTLYDKNPEHVGSLGIAISEGLEAAEKDPKAVYCLGSVLNHVLLHQTVIGLETQKQFKIFDDYPDMVISCLGGGSNFGGFALPFVGDVLKKGKKIKFIAAQSQFAPNLQGKYEYDFADYAEKTPMLKMYTLGHKSDMKPIKGDGLRYHGCSPIISLLRNKGYIDTIAYPGDERHVFENARLFMETEGWLPAPESSYSICCAIDEAIKCRESGEKKVIAFNISGHGFLDIPGFCDVLGLD
ncbi:MAG: TrpB-like pyridoxal phosphate-dependent enzyme [Candidatus Eisenbacteria bacterium]|nr:TrpB-like pyridoxal phosphate-dependent enzyme [Candidatus Eisenbacteria bacterium]